MVDGRDGICWLGDVWSARGEGRGRRLGRGIARAFLV